MASDADQTQATPDPVPPLMPPSRSLWGNFSFMLMWMSVAASGFGDRMVQISSAEMLGFRAEDAQRSGVQAGVLFFFFLPYLVFGPLGGWLADTLPRKWIMFSCDQFRGLILLISALLLVPYAVDGRLPEHWHWQVYALMFLVGVCAGVFAPTRNATVPQVVPRESLQSANAVILGITTIAAMVGLLAAGQIVERGAVQKGLLVGMLLYMISGSFFAFLRVRPMKRHDGQRRGQWRRIVQGLGYIRRHRRVAWLVLVYMLIWAGASILLAATAAFVGTHYDTPRELIWTRTTTLQGSVGLGMLASALLLAWLNTRRESAWVAMVALAVTGLLLAVMTVNRSFPVALVLAFALGFSGNATMITVSTLTQLLSANYIRGRVFGARELLSTVVIVLVHLAIWRMPDADAMMVPAMAGAAGVLLTVGALGAWAELRRGPLPGRWLSAAWHLVRLYGFAWHKLRFTGRHHVPRRGPVILAANHTAGVDPFLIQAGIPRLVRWVMLHQYRFRVLEPMWRAIEPVMLTRQGQELGQLRQMMQYLKAGEVLGIFPEGQIQRGHRDLGELEPGIGLLARRSKAPIVPVWISGTPCAAKMLWHFVKPSHTHILFGRPYHPDPAWTDQQVTDDLRCRMLELAAMAQNGRNAGADGQADRSAAQ